MTIRALLVSATVLAVAAAAQPAPAPAPGDFAVATYNVNYGNADLEGVVRSIRASGADLVALQETNRRSETYLRKELAKTYPHMAFHDAPAAGGFAILSKTPLEKARYLPPMRAEGGWFGTQTARVALGRRELLIVNIHLTATVPTKDMDARGLVALFAKTDVVRDKEIRAIVGALPKRWPVFVLGDFNSIPKLSGVPGFMAQRGFTDCLAETVKDADATPTWHWSLGGVKYDARLDYIFSARMNAAAAGGAVVEGGASDHFLVTCAFKKLPLPVALGESRAEALNVVYLVDTAGMTPERAATARGLVSASMAGLTDAQNFCVVIPDARTAFPPELSPATDETRALVAEALKNDPAPSAALPAAVRRAAALLEDEASPKALFVLSDRPANDPALLKSVRALNADKRLQIYLLDAAGTPLAE